MVKTERDFAAAVCEGMGWQATPWRVGVLLFWGGNEFPDEDNNGNSDLFDQAFNPLATTRLSANTALNLNFNNGNGPGNWNDVPVRVYASFEDGVRATVETLQLSYYQWIRKCFEDQTGYQQAVGPNDFTSWVGSAAYGQRVVNFMNTYTGSKVLEVIGSTPQGPAIDATEAERIASAIFLPLLEQAIGTKESTFADQAGIARVRAKLAAPAGQMPPSGYFTVSGNGSEFRVPYWTVTQPAP